jgi:hypothetical protein
MLITIDTPPVLGRKFYFLTGILTWEGSTDSISEHAATHREVEAKKRTVQYLKKIDRALVNESLRHLATAHSSNEPGPWPIVDPPHDLTGLTSA